MPHDKYEDEIRDILNRMDDFIPDESQRNRIPKKPSPSFWSGWSGRFRRQIYTFDSNSFMVGFIVLALVAAILHRVYPPFGAIAAISSFACLVIAIALPMMGRRYGRPEQRWRGKVIELNDYRPRRPASWQYAWWRIKRFFGWK